MKAIVNLPTDEEAKKELGERVAKFHAILVHEYIKRLDLNDASKKKLLNKVIEYFEDKEKCMSD